MQSYITTILVVLILVWYRFPGPHEALPHQQLYSRFIKDINSIVFQLYNDLKHVYVFNTGISLNGYNLNFRYKQVHEYQPAARPGGKLCMFNTGAEHSKPPHNLTIVKVSPISLELSLNIFIEFIELIRVFSILYLKLD